MKKVERVSIGRYAFTLDEDASRDLAGYIEALKKHYSGNSDCDEIVDAFEDRMAELLLERKQGENIVTTADIDAIKAQIGAPESFGDTQESTEPESGDQNDGKRDEWWKNDSKKKMFRPKSGRIIGGVAAAMAKAFNIDATLMRLIWAVLGMVGIWLSDQYFDGAFAFVCLAYVVLWICIPSATQHQEMMNAENGAERNEFWKICGNIFRIMFGGILAIVGVCGIAAGVTALCGITIFDLTDIWNEITEDMVFDLNPGTMAIFSKVTIQILLSICYFIPFIVFLYEGLKVCFEFKSPKWHPGLILTLVWFIAIIAASITIAAAFLPTLSI